MKQLISSFIQQAWQSRICPRTKPGLLDKRDAYIGIVFSISFVILNSSLLPSIYFHLFNSVSWNHFYLCFLATIKVTVADSSDEMEINGLHALHKHTRPSRGHDIFLPYCLSGLQRVCDPYCSVKWPYKNATSLRPFLSSHDSS